MPVRIRSAAEIEHLAFTESESEGFRFAIPEQFEGHLIVRRFLLQQLLELFLIEKALYELRYEINMRPDWVGVPLRGLMTLVQTRAVDTGDAG